MSNIEDERRRAMQMISFDYAIKYLLKDKKDYDIVEGFISAILNAVDKPSVKICTTMDPESHKESFGGKRSLADLIVEDDNHKKYIVEIERSHMTSYVQKACFNTSRLVVDSIESGSNYEDIKKVYHISILYFNVPFMNEPIAHGRTTFQSVEGKKPVSLVIKDKKGNACNLTDVLPEYFIICTPLFKGDPKRELDEWIYTLKEGRVPPDAKSPYMKKVKEKLDYLLMTREERDEYTRYMKDVLTEGDRVATAERIGMERGVRKGMKKGVKAGIKEVAIKMKRRGLKVEHISEMTGLASEEVSRL